MLRCALLKQQRQLSYEELAFHLGFGVVSSQHMPLAWSPEIGAAPDDQRDPARDLKAVNHALVVSAKRQKLGGATVRIDGFPVAWR